MLCKSRILDFVIKFRLNKIGTSGFNILCDLISAPEKFQGQLIKLHPFVIAMLVGVLSAHAHTGLALLTFAHHFPQQPQFFMPNDIKLNTTTTQA